METTSAPTKQVTVDVPEDRVPEFYAWYARFLAGPGRRRRHRHHGHGPCGCGPRRESEPAREAPEGEEPTEV
jgi:hypothetical protein